MEWSKHRLGIDLIENYLKKNEERKEPETTTDQCVICNK